MDSLGSNIDVISESIKQFIANNQILKTLEAEVAKLLEKKKMSRQQQISNLINSYKASKLVIVLGAGVSVEHGLPDWNTLLHKLLLNAFISDKNKTDEKSIVLAKLFTQVFSPSPLISARYLRSYYQDNFQKGKTKLNFEDVVRKAVYEEMNQEIESNLFKEIRQFCIAPGNSPNLDSIITYNYDDILETYLSGIEVEIPFKSIYYVGSHPVNGELPIYHVHGFLPQKDELTEKNKIILSEDMYHEQYKDIYSWNNIIQINKFTYNTCLFIGMSFTDPNLRRLLDIAMLQRGSINKDHYLIKIKYNLKTLKETINKILNQDTELLNKKLKANLELDETVEKLVSVVEKFEENDALSFGVRTIWIDDPNEIPDILKRIRTGK